MLVITSLPILLSALILAAHFYRSGSLTLTAIALLFPLLLVNRHPLIPKIISVFLLLAAGEWVRTMLIFIEQYQAMNHSWIRLAIILSAVALFTALSTLVFLTPGMKKRYLKTATKEKT